MPLVYYKAWNTSSNAPETGDAANHTITLDVDGTTVAGLTPTEDANGVYHVEPSDAQLPVGSQWVLHGTSSTADVQIFGTTGWRAAQDDDTAVLAAVDGVDTKAAAIKAKTDQLEFTGAGDTLIAESTNMRGTDDALLAANYTAPDDSAAASNAEIVRKLLYNKTILHPSDPGWQQVLDDDGVTPWMEFRLTGVGTRERRTP